MHATIDACACSARGLDHCLTACPWACDRSAAHGALQYILPKDFWVVAMINSKVKV